MKFKKILISAFFIGSFLTVIPCDLWCADNESKDTVELETVTVTANKMEEDIQDVPQSITVIDEFVLEEKGIKNVADVINEIPNMSGTMGVHGNAVSFRGLNPSMFTNNNPVVLYIDGVPTTDRYAFDASLANVERVEVLRGPQGTLYGKDAIGGVINIITKNPTNEWHGKVGTEYGSNNYMQGIINLNGPLVKDTLYFGLNGQYQHDDGWLENIHAGMDSDAAESDDQRISGYFLYTPTEKLSARLTLSNDYREESYTKGYALPGGSDISDFHRDDAEEVDFDIPTDTQKKSFSQSLHVNYEFESMTLTSTTTHNEFNIEGDYDSDYGNDPLFEGLKQFHHSELDTWTQELRLSSNEETGIRWVGGAYFDNEEYDQGPYGMQFPNFNTLPPYNFLGNFEMNAESQGESETRAAFGQVITPLSERFELTLGGRYQQIEKEVDLDMYYLPVGVNGAPMYEYQGGKSWDAFLPRAALTYQINNTWTTYASYSHGYMPGGFNYFATSGTLEENSFEPQTSKNYEVGIKGTMDRLRTAVSLFYMDIEDIHVYKATGTGLYYTENAEKAHSQGAELDLTYQLTDSIELTGALGVINAEYDNYDAGDGLTFDGQKIQNTPSHTASIGVAYLHPRGFYSRLDMKNQGDIHFYDDVNKKMVKEDSNTVLDAKIGYRVNAWDFYIYGKNLTDEEYITDFISSDMITLADFGDPRTIGVGLLYRF